MRVSEHPGITRAHRVDCRDWPAAIFRRRTLPSSSRCGPAGLSPGEPCPCLPVMPKGSRGHTPFLALVSRMPPTGGARALGDRFQEELTLSAARRSARSPGPWTGAPHGPLRASPAPTGWKENVGAPASLGAGDASTPLTSSPCPLCAAVVHERGELLHRPVERHGHARPLLFHRRNCVPVSGLFLSWRQVALASLGRRGEGKIPDVQAQISLCPAPPGLSQKATGSASWRHSMPAKSCFRSSPPGALSLKRDPQCFTLLTELGAGSLGSEEAGER